MIYAGIYIHIPFCNVKCMYCDFYSISDKNSDIPDFIKALTYEIEHCSIDTSKWIFDTIFIGGGTPSLIKENHMEKILSCMHKKFNLTQVKELTIEVNPGEAPKDRLKAFHQMGINRLSMGVQSFQPELLKFLTRMHGRDEIFETYDNIRWAGFQNVNCDLIYSIPGQTKKMWEDDLKSIINLDPEHISAYTLTAEKGTELFSLISEGQIKMPRNSQIGSWFTRTHEVLLKNGYSGYEISNFSKERFECMHNLHYWNIEPYLAFGPSAHGFDGIFRWNNARSLKTYMELIMAGKSPISSREKLGPMDKTNEIIGFGMRMLKGINLKNLPTTHLEKCKVNFEIIMEKYPNCIERKAKNYSFTNKGLLFADQIIPDLLI